MEIECFRFRTMCRRLEVVGVTMVITDKKSVYHEDASYYLSLMVYGGLLAIYFLISFLLIISPTLVSISKILKKCMYYIYLLIL